MTKRLLILIGLGLFITGCQTKEITCNKSQIKTGIQEKTTLTASFKNKKIDTYKLTTRIILDEDYQNNLQDVYDAYKEKYDNLNSECGLYDVTNYNYSTKVDIVIDDERTISIHMTIKVSKLSTEEQDNFNLKITSKQLQEEWEDLGYKC